MLGWSRREKSKGDKADDADRRLHREGAQVSKLLPCWIAGIALGIGMAVFYLYYAGFKPRPAPAPVAPVVRELMVAVPVRMCRVAMLGIYELDTDVRNRYQACISLPLGFKPGETLVLITDDAKIPKGAR